jgi:hypothetical protein
LLNAHSALHGFYSPFPRVSIFAAPRERITILGMRDLAEECGDEKQLERETGGSRVEGAEPSHAMVAAMPHAKSERQPKY